MAHFHVGVVGFMRIFTVKINKITTSARTAAGAQLWARYMKKKVMRNLLSRFELTWRFNTRDVVIWPLFYILYGTFLIGNVGLPTITNLKFMNFSCLDHFMALCSFSKVKSRVANFESRSPVLLLNFLVFFYCTIVFSTYELVGMHF